MMDATMGKGHGFSAPGSIDEVTQFGPQRTFIDAAIRQLDLRVSFAAPPERRSRALPGS